MNMLGQLSVRVTVPDEALIQDMVDKARAYASENAKKGTKTSYSLTREQLSAINDSNREWYKKQFEIEVPNIRSEAYDLTVCIPIMVIRDHFKDLIKKEVDGKGREERFFEYLRDLFVCYKDKLVTLDDLRQCLYEETGIKIVD